MFWGEVTYLIILFYVYQVCIVLNIFLIIFKIILDILIIDVIIEDR